MEKEQWLSIDEVKKLYPSLSNEMIFRWIKTSVVRSKPSKIQPDRKRARLILGEDLEKAIAKELELSWIKEFVDRAVEKALGRKLKLVIANKLPINPDNRLLGVQEIATILDCDKRLVYGWLKDGRLKNVIIPDSAVYKVHPDDLAEFLGLPIEKLL